MFFFNRFLQSILVCILSSTVSQERHTKHQHQHQHHHHHNIQRQHLAPINGKSHHSNNKTFGGHAWLSHPDNVENELEKRAKNSGWSNWSDWSTCSRSCDGGIASQLRRCHQAQGCRGEPVRYRICNMQVKFKKYPYFQLFSYNPIFSGRFWHFILYLHIWRNFFHWKNCQRKQNKIETTNSKSQKQ